MVIPRVASVHVNVQAELVSARVDIISSDRVVQGLQNLRRPSPPPVRLDLDVRGRLVGSFKQVPGVQLRRQLGEDVLVVVSSEL